MDQNQEKISLAKLIPQIPTRSTGIDCVGLKGSERAYFIARLYREMTASIVVLVSSPQEAERFMADLRFFMPDAADVLNYFPPYNILPFKFIAYHSETAARRMRTLYRLLNASKPSIIVTTIGALMQKLIPRRAIIDFAELIMAGEELDRDHLIAKLQTGGYSRTIIVEEPGDFSVRGGIIDIFTPLYRYPLRIELFGDVVDSLRFFSVDSQRTVDTIYEAVILPSREAILTAEDIGPVIGRVRERAAYLEMPVTRVRTLVDRIKSEGSFPGVESLLPLIYPQLETFFDYAPPKTVFVQAEPGELQRAAEDTQSRTSANFEAARAEKRLCVEPDSLYLDWPVIESRIGDLKPLTMKLLAVVGSRSGQPEGAQIKHLAVSANDEISATLKSARSSENLLLPLADWIKDRMAQDQTTLVVCRSKLQMERLQALLDPYEVPLRIEADFRAADLRTRRRQKEVIICQGEMVKGFVWPDEALALMTETEIFGARRGRRKRRRPTKPTELLDFGDLKQGELVVHDDHGIGRYDGLVKLEIEGATSDFLLIGYKDEDRLYLPVDRMNAVQKYRGVDSIVPVLDKMGGKAWQRVKAKVKKSTEKIAGELLKLYATRKVQKGNRFGVPDDSFRHFETGFRYEETSDQIKAIEDVLDDMSDPKPMDRLVCGDVGYGKTEVALRAAYLAIYNEKQVAVLVPTTVLAEQHYATFSERFAPYPINLACLSRFRSTAEQRRIVADLKTGKIDIVIGTHRLLQKDVGFKDLGLIVLDEEQRFGVRHKEKLKHFRQTVDVLALTATPIPRTLHMSLMGIRDISVISTPPEFRQAIVTYISEFDEAVMKEAIRRELDRQGQIFFVHNNINTIGRIAEKLQTLVPEVRIGIAHGRQHEEELEQVMLDFVNKEIDLLVCTTIIESGLDIPSANTIIVNRADRFGLAQIYQLRGRVGRSDEQAYAYLFIPGESIIGKDAQKRLKVLMEHSDLGSGFKIAMSDLEIRGGGTILGASQSGHVAAVGYDMFLKLMEESISELKGEAVQAPLEPEINMPLAAFIPETYVPDIDQRLAAYRRLSKMTALGEIAEYKKELIDRFGPLPAESANLLLKMMVRALAINAGVKRLDLGGNQLFLYFSVEHQKDTGQLVDMVLANQARFQLKPNETLTVKLAQGPFTAQLSQVKNILKEIAQRVNS